MTAYDLTRITAARERRGLQAALDREAALIAENMLLRSELARCADLLTAEGMRRNEGETVPEVLANYITRNRLFVHNHPDPTDYQGAD